MTQITVQDGKIVMRDGKVGTGGGCCCGEAEEEGDCNDCQLQCCLSIQGRDLCNPGQDGNESWFYFGTGIFGTPTAYWFNNIGTITYYIVVDISACNPDGTYDVQIQSVSSDSPENPQNIAYQWLAATGSRDANGCLNGINFGGRTVACDPNGCGSTTPVDPDISLTCA